MTDIGAWLIGLAFYAPIHYLGPLLVIVLTGPPENAPQIARIRTTVVECTLTMVVAFGLAVGLFSDHPGWAAGILVTAMLIPYLHLHLVQGRSRFAPPDAC